MSERSERMENTSQCTCSVSLAVAEWQAVLENLQRGIYGFEAATNKPASGLRALYAKIYEKTQNDRREPARSKP